MQLKAALALPFPWWSYGPDKICQTLANDTTHLHFQTLLKCRWYLFGPASTPRGTRQNGTDRNGPRSARPERNGTANPNIFYISYIYQVSVPCILGCCWSNLTFKKKNWLIPLSVASEGRWGRSAFAFGRGSSSESSDMSWENFWGRGWHVWSTKSLI